jgi:hypothetical protein
MYPHCILCDWRVIVSMIRKNVYVVTLAAVAAAILLGAAAISTGGNSFASGQLQSLVADDRDDNKRKAQKFLSSRADFVSKDCIVTGFAESNLSPEALAALDCEMQAWLDKRGKTLLYKIQISGMELVDTDGDTQDDVNQLHIHKRTGGTDANPMGPHQLNVFRAPGFDDSDVVIKPVQGIISGIWDDGDENLSYGEPDNSHKLSENLELLCEGQIFAAAHGDVEDVPGHKAPYLKMVLEPTKYGDRVCHKLGLD